MKDTIKIDFKKELKNKAKKDYLDIKKIEVLIVSLFLFIFLSFLGDIIFEFNKNIKEFFSFLRIFLILIWSFLILFFINKISSFKEEFFKFFAQKYNFSFLKSIEVFKKDIFSYTISKGKERKIENYLQGKIKGREIELYNFYHSFKAETQELNFNGAFEYLVLETNTEKKLPNFIVGDENIFLSFLPSTERHFRNSDLQTESNEFNRNFKIYSPENPQETEKLEILDILTPDLMLDLLRAKEIYNFFLEFKENRIFLFRTENSSKDWKSFVFWDKKEKEILYLINLLFKILEEVE